MDSPTGNLTQKSVPYSWMLADSLEERLQIAESLQLARYVLFPILLAMFYLGFILATITITRKKIRKYSSAVYLYAMFLFDFIFMTGWYLEKAIILMDVDVNWVDEVCPVWGALDFVGRVGSLFITIILAIERILVLSNPARFHYIATTKTATLFSGICLAMVTALSGVNMDRLVWGWKARRCLHEDEIERGWRQNLFTTYTLAFTFSGILIQVVVNAVLGYLLRRKRNLSRLDPIRNSISAARQRLDQLNKINLIVFLMSINSFIFSLINNINNILFWKFFFRGRPMSLFVVVVPIVRFLGMFLVAVKPFVIGIASRDVRREFWLALRCRKKSSILMSRGIEVNPEKLRQREAAEAALNEPSSINAPLHRHTKDLKRIIQDGTSSHNTEQARSTESSSLSHNVEENRQLHTESEDTV